MNVEFKDLIGLSKPLTKLVEVISAGLGKVSNSYLIRQDADARAYEIKKIAEAVNESRDLLADVRYEKSGILVTADNRDKVTGLETVNNRALARASFQEERKQHNLEQITQNAAQEVAGKSSVSDEPVDDDWIAKFFNLAEDVSSEEMQILWGRVLAGEVEQPKSFSLRTLELLKSLSKEEALLFDKISQFAIKAVEKHIILNPDRGALIEQELDISFSDIMKLKDAGLLHPNEIALRTSKDEADNQDSYPHWDTVMVFNRKGGTQQKSLNAIAYTAAGEELLKLITHTHHLSCIKQFSEMLIEDNVTGFYALIIEHLEKSIRYNADTVINFPLK